MPPLPEKAKPAESKSTKKRKPRDVYDIFQD